MGFLRNSSVQIRLKRLIAFTLAEVLITLGIIGIVAAITIPTLMNSYQKQQYATSLKKVYTNVNQVLKQLAADNGCVDDLRCTGIFDEFTSNDYMGSKIVSYFKTARDCGTNTGCFAGKVSTYIDGSGTRDDAYKNSNNYKFTTMDGMNFSIYNDYSSCGNGMSRNVTRDMQQICAYLFVDVNGDKGPNNFGRDIFYFYITNGRGPWLYPAGGIDDDDNGPWDDQDRDGTIDAPSAWACSASNPYGMECSGRIIDENWQMNY